MALISLFTDRFWQILSQNVCFDEYYSKITYLGKLNPSQEKVNNTFMLFMRLQIEGNVHDKIQFMKKVDNTFMLFTRLQIEWDVHDKIRFMKNPSISET